MAEKETIFESKMKNSGIFPFPEFYRFCYDWLIDETGVKVIEDKYVEKLKGDSKDIDIAWTGVKEITDYFKYEIKVTFRILGLKKVQITQNNVKVDTNEGSVEIKVKGNLIRDYKGKFEKTYIRKFLRSIYEKWIIPAQIEQYEANLIGKCDEFLEQAKAYLALEGKR